MTSATKIRKQTIVPSKGVDPNVCHVSARGLSLDVSRRGQPMYREAQHGYSILGYCALNIWTEHLEYLGFVLSNTKNLISNQSRSIS